MVYYNYSTGCACACAVAVTGLMAGTGPVAVPGAEAEAATDTGAGDQYCSMTRPSNLLAGSTLAPLVGDAPLSRMRKRVP
jgi:hypothetical protein